MPWWSPRICTSMCLARGMYSSRNTAALPKARSASPCASSSKRCEVARLLRRPHAAAAAAERRLDDAAGNRCPARRRSASSRSVIGSSVPGSIGTPAAFAAARGGGLVAHHARAARAAGRRRRSRRARTRARTPRSPTGSRSRGESRPPLSPSRCATMPSMSRYAATGPLPFADHVGLVRLEAVDAEAVLLRVRSRLCASPSSVAARKMRMAISLRLAARTFLIGRTVVRGRRAASAGMRPGNGGSPRRAMGHMGRRSTISRPDRTGPSGI